MVVVVRLFYFIIPIIIDNLSVRQVINNALAEEFSTFDLSNLYNWLTFFITFEGKSVQLEFCLYLSVHSFRVSETSQLDILNDFYVIFLNTVALDIIDL